MGNSNALLQNKKDACKTFVEQTKLLVALSSAFVIAPAAVKVFLELKGYFTLVSAELSFIVSVLLGDAVLGTVAGSQFKGDYDVYRTATRVASLLQLVFYVIGLILFVVIIAGAEDPSPC